MKRVCIALSGGVDSAVSALLLKEQGHDVFALFMRNWEEADGSCPAEKDSEDVATICKAIDIPFFTVDFTQEYWDEVFTHFLAEFKAGRTPNPDIACNTKIKFKTLYNKAKSLGADFLATGHYCQTREGQLLRGLDPNKDQSYFLYAINRTVLKDVLFPIGGMHKSEVREIARVKGLPVSEKKDSTGICFIGERRFRTFLSTYLAPKEGPFMTPDGKEVGRHEGAHFYTIGQRKGLGIGGPGDAWFVSDKDVSSNTVTVVQGESHPDLYHNALEMEKESVILPYALPEMCSAKIRYRQTDSPCVLQRETVYFDQLQRAITPGQSIVFYDNEVCLGGGIIKQRWKKCNTHTTS